MLLHPRASRSTGGIPRWADSLFPIFHQLQLHEPGVPVSVNVAAPCCQVAAVQDPGLQQPGSRTKGSQTARSSFLAVSKNKQPKIPASQVQRSEPVASQQQNKASISQ